MHNQCENCKITISPRAKKCRKCSKLGHGWPEGYHEKQSQAQKNRFSKNKQWNTGRHWEHLQGEGNGQWKGDGVGIKALHRWVRYHRGRPRICENCGTRTAKAYDWANKDHKYKRVLSDYVRLCRSCHRKYDITNNGYKIKGKYVILK